MELLQDGLVIALGLLQSAEAKGKQVSPGNIAYYTLKHLRAGRRSTGFRKNDALHPASKSHQCRVYSLEGSVATDDGDEIAFSEILASASDDPAVEAGRRLDGQVLLHKLDDVAKSILHALADGSELTRLVSPLKLSRSTLQSRKQKLATRIRECLGDDILRQVQEPPGWHNGLEATHAIADGLYAIICEPGEEAIVAFGMVPKWIMDLTEKLVREKVVAKSARQLGITVEELNPYVDERLLRETVSPIIH